MNRPIILQATDTLATCKMCHSRNVVQRSTRIHHDDFSHWFDCRACGYSTPGRATSGEAIADVDWTPLVRQEETR